MFFFAFRVGWARDGLISMLLVLSSECSHVSHDIVVQGWLACLLNINFNFIFLFEHKDCGRATSKLKLSSERPFTHA